MLYWSNDMYIAKIKVQEVIDVIILPSTLFPQRRLQNCQMMLETGIAHMKSVQRFSPIIQFE